MTNTDVKCDLCGKKFKTCSKIVTRGYGYDEYEETCYYPVPEENAHLVHNYICDDCYNNIGDVVKQLFINEGEKFNKNLSDRKQKALDKYNEEIANLEDENKKVVEITNILKGTKSMLELDEEIVKDLGKKFPYTLGATYYLDRVIDIEKRTKQNKQNIHEWSNNYGIKIVKLPKEYSWSDMIDNETFKTMLLNCTLKDIKPSQLMSIIRNIWHERSVS